MAVYNNVRNFLTTVEIKEIEGFSFFKDPLETILKRDGLDETSFKLSLDSSLNFIRKKIENFVRQKEDNFV